MGFNFRIEIGYLSILPNVKRSELQSKYASFDICRKCGQGIRESYKYCLTIISERQQNKPEHIMTLHFYNHFSLSLFRIVIVLQSNLIGKALENNCKALRRNSIDTIESEHLTIVSERLKSIFQ